MRRLRALGLVEAVCALAVLGALVPTSAQGNRDLITEEAVTAAKTPVPEGQIEGACGVALFGGTIYVSDYYHGLVEGFPGALERLHAGTSPEGPCGLAVDSTGALYVNIWHESVVRLKPSLQVFDEDSSTGVAVDPKDSSNSVYVNDRTRIVRYAPSGALSEEIGGGSLFDAYGLAVFMGRVYVPDAASGTVKVFEPAKSTGIIDTIEPPGGFTSLVDASVAIDPTNGHVLVVDNLQPGFEHPVGAVDEFDAEGDFLEQLNLAQLKPGQKLINGGPTGITLGSTGTLYVTSGNSEKSTVFAFGPYTEAGPEAAETLPPASVPPIAGPPVPEGGVQATTRSSAESEAQPRSARNRPHRHRRSRASRLGLARAQAIS